MLISTRLHLIALLPMVITLLIGGVLWVTWSKLELEQQDVEIAEKIRRFNFELNTLTQEYLLYDGARIESQWHIRYQSIGELLAQLNYEDSEGQELAAALRQNYQELGSIYKLLLENMAGKHEQLVAALLVIAQSMRTKMHQLTYIQHRQVVEFQRIADQSIILALVLLVAICASLLFFLSRQMERSINQLDIGVRQIAGGNLDQPISLATTDELGTLAHAFDDMRCKLRDSYTSIEALNIQIAERKRAEDALKKSQALLNDAQRVSKLGGWEYDVSSGVVYWSDEVYRLHGVEKEDYDPSHPQRDMLFYAPDDQGRIAKAFQQAIERGEPYDLELQLIPVQGEHLWVRTTGQAEIRDGKTVRVFGNIMDVTAAKLAREEIHQLNAELEQRVHSRTAELEAANKELGAFAYSVSHDLRAPLRAIDGFSRKVMMNYGDKLGDEGRRQLQVVRDSVQKMGQLIDDLLAFSRMGRREMTLKPLDMDAMVNSVADELRTAEPQRVIEFAFSPLPYTWGDAAMLRQVWVNLLGNAVKFTRQRQVAHIEVGGRTEGGEVVYWVKDDGAGFDMQYADKLFGVFQRLHRQDEFEGNGVGLAVVQRILHRHNGRIWGEGKPDAGATFQFALPIPSPENQL